MFQADGCICYAGAVESMPCPALPNCVVFAGDSSTAQAISAGTIQAAIRDRLQPDGGLVWAPSVREAPRALCVDNSGRVAAAMRIAFGQSVLEIPAGATVTQSQTGYKISGEIRFASAAVHGGVVEVSTAVTDAGTLTFRASITPPADLSIRYFYSPQPSQLAGFRYPVFGAPPNGAVRVEARLDPASPSDPRRNSLVALEDAWIPSSFLSVAGQPLGLSVLPSRSGWTTQWDPVEKALYPAPLGEWGLSLAGATGPNVMCGLSGLEFARINSGGVIEFVPGAPAYAPAFGSGATATGLSLTAQCPGSTYPVTTSWAYFANSPPIGAGATAPPGPLGYYSQPYKGGLFQPVGTGPFLQSLQMQVAVFPAGASAVFGAPAPSFPMAPYAGVTAPDSASSEYIKFEIEVLSPTRNNAIYEMNFAAARQLATGPAGLGPQSGPLPSITGVSGPMAVTPQGMLSTFSPNYSEWERLILATTGDGSQTMEMRFLNQELRAALLTNQLFLVVSNKQAFQAACTVLFPGLEIAGWNFELSPSAWRSDTVMIIKSAEKPMRELINDMSLWSAPKSGFYDQKTQTILQQSVADAEANANLPEFAYFLETVLEDWNGILFLNCTVPANEFPAQLKGLAAGLDLSKFKAHHVGVNLSPVTVVSGQIEIASSSLFGLIFYDNPGDLAYQGNPYDFKVLSLRVLFANSDISSFSSQVELLVGQLFGEPSSLVGGAHGDNLVLNGVMQKHGDQESYSFSEVGSDIFTLNSQVLDRILISRAQFVTLPQKPGNNQVSSLFLLRGAMSFRPLPELDLFSFGASGPGPVSGLQFANLGVSMVYGPSGPTGPTGPTGHTGPTGGTGPIERSFSFEAGNMAFDLASSQARPQSLYSRFPLQVTGMVQGNAKKKPQDLGYIPMDSPLNPGSLGDTWFGLAMSLNLGSQGSLAAKAGFYATFLAAWAPSPQAYNAAAAIQLPGSQGGSKSLTIEGPLKLSIGSLAVLYNKAQKAYLMRFSNIALSLLSLKFPPGGRTNILLFGDPNPAGSNTTLGWYAAYMKDKSKTGPSGPTGPNNNLDLQSAAKQISGKARLE